MIGDSRHPERNEAADSSAPQSQSDTVQMTAPKEQHAADKASIIGSRFLSSVVYFGHVLLINNGVVEFQNNLTPFNWNSSKMRLHFNGDQTNCTRFSNN